MRGPVFDLGNDSSGHADKALVLGETSEFIGCSHHIQQPAAANLYRKSYTQQLNAAQHFGCSQRLCILIYPLSCIEVMAQILFC